MNGQVGRELIELRRYRPIITDGCLPPVTVLQYCSLSHITE
jgi:hypothetical protein